jgi:hypothetical protein
VATRKKPIPKKVVKKVARNRRTTQEPVLTKLDFWAIATKELTELAQEGAAATIAPDATAVGMNPMVGGLPTTDAFLPGDDRPTSSGAPGGPGEDGSNLSNPIDAIDQTQTLARALLLANPDSIQLALIVDAYNQELDNAI